MKKTLVAFLLCFSLVGFVFQAEQSMANGIIPEKPSGNSDLYLSDATFLNPSIFSKVAYSHNNGTLSNSNKTAEDSSVLNTKISNQSQMIARSTGIKVSINALTFVTKTKLTINEMGTETWHGAGIIIRYDNTLKTRMMVRYSQDGILRITGYTGSGVQYLAQTIVPISSQMNLAVVQTSSKVEVFINSVLKLTYDLSTSSPYLSTPYAFGLYTIYSASTVTETSLYFSEDVDLITASQKPAENENLYLAAAGFEDNSLFNLTATDFTNSNGILRSNNMAVEDVGVLVSGLTGNPYRITETGERVRAGGLTVVTKVKMITEETGNDSWNGSGLLIRYDPVTQNRILIRFSRDGILRLLGTSSGSVNYLAQSNVIVASVLNVAVEQTSGTVKIYVDDILRLNYTFDASSGYRSMPFSFGIYTTKSKFNISQIELYFAEKAMRPVVPSMPDGNDNLYEADAPLLDRSIYEVSSSDMTNTNNSLLSNNVTAEDISTLLLPITNKNQVINVPDNSLVNSSDKTFVTNGRLSITEIGTETWYGLGVVLRYHYDTRVRLLLRYSQDGILRIVGFNGATIQYLTQTNIPVSNTMEYAVVQTKNMIDVYINGELVLSYRLPADSAYLNTPYAFGLYTVHSKCSLSNNALYFAERVNVIDETLQEMDELYGNETADFETPITVRELMSQFTRQYKLQAVNRNLSELNDTDLLGTGCKLIYHKNGQTIKQIYSVVRDDVTGDGRIGIADLIVIKNHMLNQALLDRYSMAALNTGENDVTIADLLTLKDKILQS